jgi:hypothetical protein
MMTICELKHDCEIASAVLAFVAAASWFYASWIGRGSFLNTGITDFDRTLTLQARYNSIAAFCAGVAALLQIWTIGFAPACRAFS